MKLGYTGGVTTVKNYISLHKDLIPYPRHILSPQGNRGRRYSTELGHCYQMDWGFVKVRDYSGLEYQTACFAMICHHCGQRYIEFFQMQNKKVYLLEWYTPLFIWKYHIMF